MMKVQEIVDYVVNLIFPKRCPVCGEILESDYNLNTKHVHDSCLNILKNSSIVEPTCLKCGCELSSLESKLSKYCTRCLRDKPGIDNFYYEKGYGLLNYTKEIKESIKNLKYHFRKEYIDFYGMLLAKKFHKEFKEIGIDYFIPVPMFKQKEKIRGYNQASLLAKAFAKYLKRDYGINVLTCENFIFRGRKTSKLSSKNDEERWLEISGAFYGRDESKKLVGKNVCIIDDIYTTGATIIHISKILKSLGAANVYFATIAIVSNRV